ncbi:MAG: periplasmic heavy metal sensor, partial [Pseudomonadota bacterium]
AIRGVLGEPFFRALPPPQRRAMVRDIVGNREQFREGREALRDRVERFLVALRATEFDRAELTRLLSQQRDAAVRRQTMGEALLLDRLESMSSEERAAYADALENRLKGIKRN